MASVSDIHGDKIITTNKSHRWKVGTMASCSSRKCHLSWEFEYRKEESGSYNLWLIAIYRYKLIVVLSPCQRQCELLPSLGVQRLLTFHILIFFSEMFGQMNRNLVVSIYGCLTYDWPNQVLRTDYSSFCYPLAYIFHPVVVQVSVVCHQGVYLYYIMGGDLLVMGRLDRMTQRKTPIRL